MIALTAAIYCMAATTNAFVPQSDKSVNYLDQLNDKFKITRITDFFESMLNMF